MGLLRIDKAMPKHEGRKGWNKGRVVQRTTKEEAEHKNITDRLFR